MPRIIRLPKRSRTELPEAEDRIMARKIFFALLFIAPLGFYPFLCDNGPSYVVDDPIDCGHPGEAPHNWSPDERRVGQVLASLPVLTGQGFPSNLPWGPFTL